MANAPLNRVRIIGGAWRGRMVRFPKTDDLRPTPDRVRETLFNWLGQELTGRRCLDLYAGTGVLSLEALSRGAALAVAVDRNRTLVQTLAATAALMGTAALEVHCADAQPFVDRERRAFDIIFLDPPFADNPWDRLLPLCSERLAAGGFIYAEAPRALPPPAQIMPWRHAKAGQVHYHLFAKPGPQP